jgi:hypothetical protein
VFQLVAGGEKDGGCVRVLFREHMASNALIPP